jgi:murein DD-endopeptidase MepM/ murein hydrolase activator NlpD
MDHGRGWKSFYGHNSQNLVREGEEVRAGEQIAEVGDTGRSTGPHLHFEIRQQDKAWDPLQIRRRLLAGLHIGKRA